MYDEIQLKGLILEAPSLSWSWQHLPTRNALTGGKADGGTCVQRPLVSEEECLLLSR